jgi:formate dehydrogenase maturation protein FdhE
MTDRTYAQDRPEQACENAALCPVCGTEVALSHPGDVQMGEREHGYRFAMAWAWRAIRDTQTAAACRERLAELGQGPAPDLTGAPRP